MGSAGRQHTVPPIADVFLGDYAFVTDTPEIIGISESEMDGWANTRDARYSGSIRLILAGAIYAKLFGEVPQEIDAFLRTDKPKILVALTSSVRDYLSSVYDCLKRLDVRVIFCTTTHSKDFEPTDNILLRDHIPSHKVMPLCDIAIIHGGQGSVQTAIASGTPVIGFALQPEQNLNLQLLESHGAELNLPFSALKGNQLKTHVDSTAIPNVKTHLELLLTVGSTISGSRRTWKDCELGEPDTTGPGMLPGHCAGSRGISRA